jgi:hypothetical protein
MGGCGKYRWHGRILWTSWDGLHLCGAVITFFRAMLIQIAEMLFAEFLELRSAVWAWNGYNISVEQL